jgi:hypothetical protein
LKSRLPLLAVVFAFCATTPLIAQPLSRPNAGPLRQELRLQSMLFGNFYQAPSGAPQEDVRGTGLEYRAAYRAWKNTDVYGHLNLITFDEKGKKNTYGGRLGIQYDGERQDFNAYVDHGENRSTFDIVGVTDTGDVTTFSADYSFRVTNDWQLGAEVEHDSQRFAVTHARENDATKFGANVRYRGFGYKFMPEIGYTTGSRDVVDPTEDYDEPYWYVRAVSSPTRRTYISLTYRNSTRDYTTRDVSSSRFGAEDTRTQWIASGSFRATNQVAYILYYNHETNESSRINHNFDGNFLLLAVSVGF